MTSDIVIRRLVPDDADAYAALRREALQREPYSFGSSPEDDVMRDVDHVRQSLADSSVVVFGAFAPGLIGTVGMRRLTKIKAHHKAEVYGMYVTADDRRRGLGEQLMRAVIECARALEGVRQVHLCVTEQAAAAYALYEKLGFKTWGVEAAALSWGGADIAERHMMLRLE